MYKFQLFHHSALIVYSFLLFSRPGNAVNEDAIYYRQTTELVVEIITNCMYTIAGETIPFVHGFDHVILLSHDLDRKLSNIANKFDLLKHIT